MTPKFYGFLWILFAVCAGVLWVGNAFTMMTAVIFGFTAFGLVFTGMMCVLPAAVSHPATQPSKIRVPSRINDAAPQSPAPAKVMTYRSV